jgi:hypothetical protein
MEQRGWETDTSLEPPPRQGGERKQRARSVRAQLAGDLLLHDEVGAQHRALRDQAAQERVRDAEGNVPDRAERLARERHTQRVAVEDPDVRASLEPAREPAGEDGVELDRDDAPAASRDLGRGHAAAGADLHDEFAGAQADPTDELSRCAATEEVLPDLRRTPGPWQLSGHGRSP